MFAYATGGAGGDWLEGFFSVDRLECGVDDRCKVRGPACPEATHKPEVRREYLWLAADLASVEELGEVRAHNLAILGVETGRLDDRPGQFVLLCRGVHDEDDVAVELRDVAESVRGVFLDPIKGFGVLSDYARRRASLAANVARGKGRFTQLPPLLAEDAALFEELTREVALAVDRSLRRHGKALVDEQLVLRRLADALIDLFTYAAMLSRISGSIENHGEAAGRAELELLRAFAAGARRRVKASLEGIDTAEDAALQEVAEHVLAARKYPWDNV